MGILDDMACYDEFDEYLDEESQMLDDLTDIESNIAG